MNQSATAGPHLIASSGRAGLRLWAGFIAPDECQAVINLARPRLQPSTVLDRATGASIPSTVRTSEGAYFAKDETPLLASLVTRAARLLELPRDNLEPLQVIRYGIGAKYEPHVDSFDPADPGSAVPLAQGGQRIKTLLAYLNTPPAGGATRFPDAGHEVQAIAGHAAQFDSNALHGGDPVMLGEKWAVNVWGRERAYGSAQRTSESIQVIDDVLTPQDCAFLRAVYDTRSYSAAAGVDRAVHIPITEPLIAPFVAKVKEQTDRFFPEAKVVETIVIARMPAGVAMENHADNVRWDGAKFVPNHTPDRTYTAVTFLQDGEGGVTHYGDSPTPGVQLDVTQKEGRAHIHRCGPDNFHRVSPSRLPRYTFSIWFKRP